MNLAYGWAFPDADEFMKSELHVDGTYQASHLRMAMPFVTDRSLAIDGGAHVGTWSKLMSALFDRVIAVEPSDDTFECLTANMAAFGCTNVEARHCALGAEAGTVTMKLEGRGLQLKNTGARFAERGGTTPCEPIDAWQLPSLGFLKLDVEGSEVNALLGARQTLKRCKPVVLFENKYLWKRYRIPRDAPQDLLTSLGYVKKAKASCDDIWVPR
jgi:FkbM family methyltransferase